jgi:4-methyl-5(b-hydroxyethyl)-thiazole monophosphate biosynthesis
MMADGCEEVEALSVVDILRRAGIDTPLISVMGRKEIVGSHDIHILADKLIEEVDFEEADMIFLPGGIPGTPNLKANKLLCDKLMEFNDNGKLLAAVCAAPSIFGELGLLKGKKATCYPGFEVALLGANAVKERVVTDGNITTSRGLGTSLELGLRLMEILKSKEAADDMARKVQFIC